MYKTSSIIIKKINIIISCIIILSFTSCDDLFDYSPYEANVKSKDKNSTAKNLQLINNIQNVSDTFSFAFVTDVHYHYDNLKTVIDDINKKDDILFVIFGGDIADQALLKEFEIFYEIAENLNSPYLTIIGNHDYKSNGETVYKQMFGDYNYSFEFNNSKFVIFDDVVWESNKTPDFDWLSNQLLIAKSVKQIFVMAHIPPFDEQFDEEMEKTYSKILSVNKVQLSIHGHVHGYSYGKPYSDGVNYLTVPWLKKPTYCIVKVIDNSFEIEIIEL